MQLANSLTLPWDLVILMLLSCMLGVCIAARHWLHHGVIRPLFLRLFVRLIGFIAGASVLVILYASFVEPQLITVTRISVPLDTVRPLRIVVISDLHLGPYKGARYLSRVVNRINALVPDLVLIAGDLVLTEEVTADVLPELRPLRNLHPSLGTFAILGNHDHGIYRRAQNQPKPPNHSDLIEHELITDNVTVLRNSSVILRLFDSQIAIAGVEDAMSGQADILKALADIPDGMPVLLLSHNPDVILDPAATRAQIIIAGHTHAGQIRLPWYGPLATLPTHLGRAYDQGLFPVNDGSFLAITRGIGESGPRMRFFAPPEILLLETVPLSEG